MANWWQPVALLGLVLAPVAGCSDEDADPFEGIIPAANGTRPVTSLTDEYAMATGIWRIDGERSASPYNVTEIWCWREVMTCNAASAELVKFNETKILSVSQHEYDVDRWTTDEISYSSSGGCRTVITKLSAKDGSVVQTVETDFTLDTCTETVREGPMGEALEVPRIIRMITTEEWNKRQDQGLE